MRQGAEPYGRRAVAEVGDDLDCGPFDVVAGEYYVTSTSKPVFPEHMFVQRAVFNADLTPEAPRVKVNHFPESKSRFGLTADDLRNLIDQTFGDGQPTNRKAIARVMVDRPRRGMCFPHYTQPFRRRGVVKRDFRCIVDGLNGDADQDSASLPITLACGTLLLHQKRLTNRSTVCRRICLRCRRCWRTQFNPSAV